MKIFVLSVILLITKANFVDTQQKILLRKLQNFQQNDSNPKTVTWNEILADVLVNKGNNLEISGDHNQNIWTKCMSQMLLVYKTYIYDNIKYFNRETSDSPTNAEPTNATPDPTDSPTEKPNDTKASVDPKTEVEIIEPEYHGRVQEISTEGHKILEGSIRDTKATECPEGFVEDEEGQCVKTKSSQFILAIPRQCPTGYRRDRMGFCRLVF